MGKIKYILMGIMAVFLIACSGDKDAEETNTESVNHTSVSNSTVSDDPDKDFDENNYIDDVYFFMSQISDGMNRMEMAMNDGNMEDYEWAVDDTLFYITELSYVIAPDRYVEHFDIIMEIAYNYEFIVLNHLDSLDDDTLADEILFSLDVIEELKQESDRLLHEL